MSSGFTPTNQKRHTNVALVKMKKGGKKFELACFKNKVMAWRSKATMSGIHESMALKIRMPTAYTTTLVQMFFTRARETDLDEVLQTHTIFVNVSKGLVAKRADLIRCFKTEDEATMVLEILAKGQLQVSKEERVHEQTVTYTEVARLVTERCVNPDTQRPYTIAQIERSMKDIHFSIQPGKSEKVQALEVIRQLQAAQVPIERAKMRIRITLPRAAAPKTIKPLIEGMITIEDEEWDDGDLELTCVLDPGAFRTVSDIVSSKSKGQGVLEITSVTTVETSDATLD